MYTTSETVGRRIRGLIAERLLTQKATAHALGMTQQGMSSRIRGRTAFTIDELEALAEFFGVDFGYLATGQGFPSAVAS